MPNFCNRLKQIKRSFESNGIRATPNQLKKLASLTDKLTLYEIRVSVEEIIKIVKESICQVEGTVFESAEGKNRN